jgi:hypothetical protein
VCSVGEGGGERNVLSKNKGKELALQQGKRGGGLGEDGRICASVRLRRVRGEQDGRVD